VYESAAADYRVARRMELEQEEFVWLKRPEICRRWGPEIDFVEVRCPPQRLEPIVIGHGDHELDAYRRVPEVVRSKARGILLKRRPA
jgi:hypothetical protein